MTPYAGFIYVMTRPTGGDVKIGISREPHQRLTEVRDNAADLLSVAAVWGHQHPRKVEAKTHRALKEFETKREWFAVSKYTAFEAVSQAMQKVDRALRLAPQLPEPPLPIEPPSSTIVVPAPYDVPKVALDPEIKFLMGYGRDSVGTPIAQQVQWMWAAGVHEANIHADLDLALKDCRPGDGMLVWSPAILGVDVASIENEVRTKGAKVIYADAADRPGSQDRCRRESGTDFEATQGSRA